MKTVSSLLFLLWLAPFFCQAQDGKIGAGKIVIDYTRELLLYSADTSEYVECSALRTPFTPASLNTLIGTKERTIYCRLHRTPAEVAAFTLPARPAVRLDVDYARVRLTGDTVGLEWKYAASPYTVRKVEMSDSIWGVVAKYPGLVDPKELRLANVPVEIDAVFRLMHPSGRMSISGSKPWFSTGLYAPPAEIITVTRPASLRGKKISCRIGASSSTLADKNKPWKRLQKTFVVKELNTDSDTTTLYNPSGGNIYIVPDESFQKPETFLISGAVKSPDFVLGKTDPQQWKDEIQSSGVPFAEIGGERMIWSMPVNILKTADDPVALVRFYTDVMINDFNLFHGLTDTASAWLHRSPEFASRCVSDIQVHAGAAYAGYPCMFGSALPYAARAVSLKRIQTSGEAWGFYHEVGHTYQVACWKWMDGPGSIGEVCNNLHVMHSHNRLFGKWHAGTDGAKGYQWYINKIKAIPLADRNYEDDAQTDGTGRLVPFAQLAQKYGWKLYAYLGKSAREMPDKYVGMLTANMGRREFFCKRVCEYANADMRPFFDFWGIKYGPIAAADMATMPSYTGEAFWETWNIDKLGSLTEIRIPGKKLPDDNYGMIPGEVARGEWTVVEGECVRSVNPDSPVENMFDGLTGTFWASQSVKRPIYDVCPVVVVDMNRVNVFDYIEYKHRAFEYNRLNCWKFKVEVREDEDSDWQLVGEFENSEDVNAFQHFDLSQTFSGRYLRLTFLEGIHEGGNTSGSVCTAEFKIGKQEK